MSGKEVSANTRLIEEFTITKPPGGGVANFQRETIYGEPSSTLFKWGNAAFALRYEPVLRFHYYELYSGSTDTIEKYIDWVLPTQSADDVSGAGSQTIDISNNGFYDFIKNNVKPVEINGHRLCGSVDFMVTAGGEEYDTYLRVNGPSYSLVQDRPEYTNVENGFGLMSSRYTVSKNRRLSPLAEDEILLLKIKVEGEDVSLGFIPNPNL